MSADASPVSDKTGNAGSFWKTLPGILTGAGGLIVAVTGLIALLVNVGWIPGKPATSTPPVSARPPSSIPARGPLLYEVTMDGRLSDLTNIRANDVVAGKTASPSDAGITAGMGSIDLFARRSGVAAAADLRFPGQIPLDYVGEMQIAIAPGSQINFSWTIRGRATVGTARYLVQVTAGEAQVKGLTLVLRLVDESVGKNVALASVPIVGGENGALVTLAAVLKGTDVTLYVDSQPVAHVSDSQVGSASGPPNIDVFATGAAGGSVRVLAARFYALP